MRRDAELLYHAQPPSFRQLRQSVADLSLPFCVNNKRQQIGLREIAIVVRLFLGTHAISPPLARIVEASFLDNFFTSFNYFDLTLNLISQSIANEAKRIHVLNFCLGPQLLFPAWTDAYIGIAAQRTLLHVAVADPGVEDDFFQAGKKLECLVRRRNIRLGHDLNQWDAAAIQVNGSFVGGVWESVVQALPCVFFEMHACDADFFLPTLGDDVDPPVLG